MERYLEELKTIEPIGNGLSLFEIEDPHYPNEYHVFHVMQSENFLYVGSMGNCGFCYHAHMERDNDFSLDENLQTLHDAIYIKLLSLNSDDVLGELTY